MHNLQAVLFYSLLITQVPAGRGSSAEATVALDDLRRAITGDIKDADDSLDALHVEFLSYADKVLEDGVQTIEDTFNTYNDEVRAINALGAASDRDLSACTDARLQELDLWRKDYEQQSLSCIRYQRSRVAEVVGDSQYVVDVVINKVDNIDFRLSRCDGDAGCVGGIIGEIELAAVRLPLDIQIEVGSAAVAVANLRATVRDCADNVLDQFVEDGRILIVEMRNCAQLLLDEAW